MFPVSLGYLRRKSAEAQIERDSRQITGKLNRAHQTASFHRRNFWIISIGPSQNASVSISLGRPKMTTFGAISGIEKVSSLVTWKLPG